jgi:hypothetical protein
MGQGPVASAAMIAATTDLVAGLPRLLAEALAQHQPPRILELPVSSPPFQMHLLRRRHMRPLRIA